MTVVRVEVERIKFVVWFKAEVEVGKERLQVVLVSVGVEDDELGGVGVEGVMVSPTLVLFLQVL